MFTISGGKRHAEIVDAAGSVVMKIEMKKIVPAKFEYATADDAAVGTLKTNSILSKKYMEVALAAGGEWTIVRDAHVKQLFSVREGSAAVVKLDITSLPLSRKYPVDIADSANLPLALGVVWAINFAQLQRVGAIGGAAG
jgi:hypothetical protein